MSRPVIDAHGHELIVSAPDESIRIDGDAVRLAQVLNNLLVNAAKYTATPSPIWLKAELREGGVSISIKDTGMGISPELLPREAQVFWDQGYDHLDLDACIAQIRACIASHLHPGSEGEDDDPRRYG